MADSKLKVDIRRKKILEELRRNGRVYVAELSRSLGVTPVTIRNDLDALEENGYLLRMSGGAVYPNRSTVIKSGSTDESEIAHLSEKKEIARAIMRMIRDGDTLFINSGTTTRLIASELTKLNHLNIVTNSLAVATVLESAPSFRVIMLGGELNTKYGFTYGDDTQEKLGRYHADWAILSVDGVDASRGITTYHAEEAVIDRMMLAGASQAVIAVDQSKLGHTGFMKVCDCSPQLQIVTNKLQDSTSAAELRKCGLTVIEG